MRFFSFLRKDAMTRMASTVSLARRPNPIEISNVVFGGWVVVCGVWGRGFSVRGSGVRVEAMR